MNQIMLRPRDLDFGRGQINVNTDTFSVVMSYNKVPIQDFKTAFDAQIGSYDRLHLALGSKLTVTGEQSCPASPLVVG